MYLVADSVSAFKCFSLENRGSIGLESEGRDTSEDRVCVEQLDTLENLLAWVSVLEEINGVLTEKVSLVLIARELAHRRESRGDGLG